MYALPSAVQVVTLVNALRFRVQPGIDVRTDEYVALTWEAAVAHAVLYIELDIEPPVEYVDAAVLHAVSIALVAWRWRRFFPSSTRLNVGGVLAMASRRRPIEPHEPRLVHKREYAFERPEQVVTLLKAERSRVHPMEAYDVYAELTVEAADAHAELYVEPPVEYGAWLYIAAACWQDSATALVEPPPLGAGALGEAVLVHWAAVREPQSAQSVPQEQPLNSEPGPPSSQSPSLAIEHVLEQPLVPVGAGEAGAVPVPVPVAEP